MEHLTAKQLYDACMQNRFLLLRFPSGDSVAVNCLVANIPSLKKKVEADPNVQTKFVSYRPCDFNEYITNKGKFI